MNPVKTVNEIEIFDNDSNFKEVMEMLIEEEPKVKSEIDGAAIVCMETTMDGKYLQDCYGADVALRILKKDSERIVICVGFLPFNFLRSRNGVIDIVMQYPNAFFLNLPFSPDSFLEGLKEAKEEKKSILKSIDRGKAILKYSSKVIGKAVHDLKVDDPKNPANDREKNIVNKTLNYVRKEFSSLEELSDDEVVDFIYEANTQREEVMKDQEIEGVYCDVEGTLLQERKINSEVLEMLNSYSQEEKEITLWTDGDVEELKSQLKDLGVEYPLKSKIDFAGATAEIVIDDLDEFTFTARTKIRSKKFIQV